MFANKKTTVHKLYLFGVLGMLFSFSLVQGQDTQVEDSASYSTISLALNNGNVDALKELMYSKIDLELPEGSGIYSNNQAYFILKDFFENNPPQSFQIINSSYNNGSNFVVGKMHTKYQHYKVCYLTKKENNKLNIYQIRIEK